MSTIITKVKEQDCVFKSRQLTTKIAHENQGFELLASDDAGAYICSKKLTHSLYIHKFQYGLLSIWGVIGYCLRFSRATNSTHKSKLINPDSMFKNWTSHAFSLFSFLYIIHTLIFNIQTNIPHIHTYSYKHTYISTLKHASLTYKQTYIHACIQTNIGTHIHLLHINSYKHSSFSLCSADTCQFY